MQVGMGFWGSKTLLSAVELELFTKLGGGPLTGPQLAEELRLHARAIPDFPDALVALGYSIARVRGQRDYRNTEATHFLDSPTRRDPRDGQRAAVSFWGDLTEALRTGKPQNESTPASRCSTSSRDPTGSSSS